MFPWEKADGRVEDGKNGEHEKGVKGCPGRPGLAGQNVGSYIARQQVSY